MNTLDELLALESELVFPSFSGKDALNLGLLFVEMADKRGDGGIGIKIEKNRKVLFSHLMDGTSPENGFWYDRKKNVCDRFWHSSKYVEELFRSQGTTFEESGLLDPRDYQAVGGSFPLIVRGAGVIGSITVCGFTGDEDHAFCVEGIRTYLASIEK